MGLVKVGIAEFQKDHNRYCHDTQDLIELDVPGSELGMYVVSSHSGVNEVLKNDSGALVHFADYFAALENKSEVDQQIGDIFARNLGNNDPIHIELRKDIGTHFNGGGLDQHIGFMRECISELIDHLREKALRNNGRVELVKDFSDPLSFLVTSHIIGLNFAGEEDKVLRCQQAGEAIKLVNLLASDEEKLVALREQKSLSEFILPQLTAYAKGDASLRKNCLLHDFGAKLQHGDSDKLQNYIEMVNGLFQAGLGAVGSFFGLCTQFLLVGDEYNSAEELQAYYFDPVRSDKEKREAISELIRLQQAKLSGLIPRYATHDTTVLGAPVKANSLVYMNFGAANCDHQAFNEPLKFNADRGKLPEGLSREEISAHRQKRKEKSLSFSYGEHMCPGRRISLTLIRYAIDGLFEAFPAVELKDINMFSEVMGSPAALLSFDVDLHLENGPGQSLAANQ